MHGVIYQQEYGYGVGFEAYVAGGLHEFHKSYKHDLDCVWIAEHSDKIVRFILLMHREPGEAQLRYFLLDTNYRGIGSGKKLAGLYMAHLLEKGYDRSYFWTTNELYIAASIYRGMGFKLAVELKSDAFGKPLIEQRYELTVKR